MSTAGNKKIDVNTFSSAETRDVQEHASGARGYTAEELVTVSAAGFIALGSTIPANSMLTGFYLKSSVGASLTGGTAPAEVAFGTSADPDAYGRTVVATLDTKNEEWINLLTTPIAVAAATIPRVSAVDSSGVADGNLTWTGVVKISYVTFDGFADFV